MLNNARSIKPTLIDVREERTSTDEYQQSKSITTLRRIFIKIENSQGCEEMFKISVRKDLLQFKDLYDWNLCKEYSLA